MLLDEIRSKWTTGYINEQAAAATWDSQAEHYKEKPVPTVEDNTFLQLLDRKGLLKSSFEVLDIGCGAGTYSFSVAPFVSHATGVDLSHEMILGANNNRIKLARENTSFMQMNWRDCDLHKQNWEDRFDLVFAHMTPAICDAVTFEKMLQAGNKYFVMCKPTRRTDSVLDHLIQMAGMKSSNYDASVGYAFQMLWEMGYLPEMSYEKETWHSERSLEQAEHFYLGRLKSRTELTETIADNVRDYLKSIAQDGIVKEEINTTITTMYWEKI